MNIDWQTLTAAGIVIITLTIFLIQLSRQKKKGSCGHNCGCGKAPSPPSKTAHHS